MSQVDDLLSRAQRAFGGNSASEALRQVRAIVGPHHIPKAEIEAEAALAALLEGRIPTGVQLSALEIVIRLTRPVVIISNGELADLPETAGRNLRPESVKAAWSDFRIRVAPFIGSIGCVEDAAGRHVGTGFVVGEDLVATNRHVLAALTSGGNVLSANVARICFKRETQSTNAAADYCALETVVCMHPTSDVVFLSAKVAGRRPLDLGLSVPSPGSFVCTIGYPGEDQANNPLFLMPVYDGRFGVKSAALGEVLDGSRSVEVFHDCSTTRGNSGSPVFDLSTCNVVGIHRSGFFMYRNEAVGSCILAEMGR